MRRYVKDESVDLIYLDPPFNSNASYNVLFAEKDGSRAAAQIQAFEDTWEWDTASSRAMWEVLQHGGKPAQAMQAFETLLGHNDMLAYLSMMAVRLIELHRVLKPTGSIYLHCDSVASHYLKVLMDAIFTSQGFRTEIIWVRTSNHGNARVSYPEISDTLFYYSKTDRYTYNRQYVPYSEDYLRKFYRFVDDNGRRYRLSDLRNPGVRPNLMY